MSLDKKTSFLACVIYMWYPTLIIFCYLILSENLFIFLFLFSLYFLSLGLSKFHFSANWKIYIILSGFFWGTASLTRSVLYPLSILLAIFFVWIYRKNFLNGIKIASLFFMTFTLTLFPWAIRNYIQFQKVVPVSTIGGLNLYMGNFHYTPLHRSWAAVDNPVKTSWYWGHEDELKGLNEAQKQQWAMAHAIDFIKNNPGLTVLRTIIKVANFWQLERTIIAGIKKNYFPVIKTKFLKYLLIIGIIVCYMVVSVCGFIGIFARYFNKRNYMDSIILFIILYFMGIHSIIFGHSRYHLPLMPILCIYMSYLLFNIKKIYKDFIFKKIAVAVLVFFSIVWSYDLFYGAKKDVIYFVQNLFNG